MFGLLRDVHLWSSVEQQLAALGSLPLILHRFSELSRHHERRCCSNSVLLVYDGFHVVLDGLQIASVAGQIRLICPDHSTVPLRNGNLAVGAGPGQFSKHCSVDGCHNLAYSATEETLNQEVQELGQQIHG